MYTFIASSKKQQSPQEGASSHQIAGCHRLNPEVETHQSWPINKSCLDPISMMAVSVINCNEQRIVCESAEVETTKRRKSGCNAETGARQSWTMNVTYLDPHENFWLGDWTEDVLNAFTVQNVNIHRRNQEAPTQKWLQLFVNTLCSLLMLCYCTNCDNHTNWQPCFSFNSS